MSSNRRNERGDVRSHLIARHTPTHPLIGWVLILFFTVPLFFPPAARWGELPADADLLQRLFPGVPASWIVIRLMCLLVGAWLLSRRPVDSLLSFPAPSDEAGAQQIRPIAWGMALVVAIGAILASRIANELDRHGEVIYFLALLSPGLILWLGRRQPAPFQWRSIARLLPVPLIWLVTTAPFAWHSPRSANLVDMWIMVPRLESVVSGQSRILTDSASPGHSNAYMILEGVSLLAPNEPVTFRHLQISHLFWTAACGVGVGAITAAMAGPVSIFLAQAVFLFSPWAISTAFNPGLNQIAPLCAITLLLLLLRVRRSTSPAAIVTFGAVIGLSTTEPTVLLMLLPLGLWFLWFLLDSNIPRPRLWSSLLIAALVAAAASLPSLPTPATIREMANSYAFGRAQLSGVVEILFGQRSPIDVQATLAAGHPGRFDIVIAALLSPFAIPRMPMRLWGDALFDPLGTTWIVIGLLAIARQVRGNPGPSLLVLLLFVTALAHGFTSRGDIVSATRLVGVALPASLLAAAGLEHVRRSAATFSPILAAGSVMLSGWMLFHVINPRLLPESWVSTSLDAIGQGRDEPTTLLEHGTIRGVGSTKWLYIPLIASRVPDPPVATMAIDEWVDTGSRLDGLLFWSPALENDRGVSRELCHRHPGARLFRIDDRAGLFQSFAAASPTSPWYPELPRTRWDPLDCEQLPLRGSKIE